MEFRSKWVVESARFYGRVALAGLCFGYCGITYAETELTLKWVHQQVLEKHPTLVAAKHKVGALEGSVLQASLKPNPELTVAAENLLGTGDFGGVERGEYTLSLSQLIERGEKREKRTRFASRAVKEFETATDVTRIELLSEATLLYLDVLLLQYRNTLLNERLIAQSKALDVIRKRAAIGAVGQADVSRVELQFASTESNHANIRDRIKLARHSLAAFWNETQLPDGPVAGDISHLPALPSLSALRELVSNSPVLSRARARLETQLARLESVRADSTRDFQVAAGVRHIEETSEQALVLDFSLPINLRIPNQGFIESARSDVELASVEAAQFHQGANANLQATYFSLKIHYEDAERIRTSLLPKSQQLVTEVESGYQTGQYTLLQWLDAQETLFDMETRLLNRHAEYFTQYILLEESLGNLSGDLFEGELK
tara:strand:+ start:13982 stop:15277 length:1296 start_codon:yes stop_codon:yes gene_type:complete